MFFQHPTLTTDMQLQWQYILGFFFFLSCSNWHCSFVYRNIQFGRYPTVTSSHRWKLLTVAFWDSFKTCDSLPYLGKKIKVTLSKAYCPQERSQLSSSLVKALHLQEREVRNSPIELILISIDNTGLDRGLNSL